MNRLFLKKKQLKPELVPAAADNAAAAAAVVTPLQRKSSAPPRRLDMNAKAWRSRSSQRRSLRKAVEVGLCPCAEMLRRAQAVRQTAATLLSDPDELEWEDQETARRYAQIVVNLNGQMRGTALRGATYLLLDLGLQNIEEFRDPIIDMLQRCGYSITQGDNKYLLRIEWMDQLGDVVKRLQVLEQQQKQTQNCKPAHASFISAYAETS
jgi:uncharacterized membrane protein